MDAHQSLDPRSNISPEVLSLVSAANARRYRVVPVSADAKTITLAIADKNDIETLDAIAFLTNRQARPAQFSPEVILEAIDTHYRRGDVKARTNGAGKTELVGPSMDQSVDIDLKAETM